MNITGFYLLKNPVTLALLHAELVLAVFKSRILLGGFRSKQSLQKIVENKWEQVSPWLPLLNSEYLTMRYEGSLFCYK